MNQSDIRGLAECPGQSQHWYSSSGACAFYCREFSSQTAYHI